MLTPFPKNFALLHISLSYRILKIHLLFSFSIDRSWLAGLKFKNYFSTITPNFVSSIEKQTDNSIQQRQMLLHLRPPDCWLHTWELTRGLCDTLDPRDGLWIWVILYLFFTLFWNPGMPWRRENKFRLIKQSLFGSLWYKTVGGISFIKSKDQFIQMWKLIPLFYFCKSKLLIKVSLQLLQWFIYIWKSKTKAIYFHYSWKWGTHKQMVLRQDGFICNCVKVGSLS